MSKYVFTLNEEQLKHFEYLGIKPIECIDEIFPGTNEFYYNINYVGNIVKTRNEGTPIDSFLISTGNCFKTNEDAEFEIERRKVITEMKRCADIPNIKTNRPNVNRCAASITYDNICNVVDAVMMPDIQLSDILFSSTDRARECIKKVGEDRIKKYYFGIED